MVKETYYQFSCRSVGWSHKSKERVSPRTLSVCLEAREALVAQVNEQGCAPQNAIPFPNTQHGTQLC